MKTTSKLIHARLVLTPVILMLFGTAYAADVFYIQARLTEAGNPPAYLCGDPPYKEVSGSWYEGTTGGSSSRSTQDPWPGPGSRFGYSTTCSLRLSPTNLTAGATYQFDTTHIGISASGNLIVNISYVNCSGTASSTDAFKAAYANVWQPIGRITINPLGLQPDIILTYASGTISSGARWYSDAYRFTDVSDPCVDALPQIQTVTGPLAEGQTFVDVPGITNTAVGVHAYADGVNIGNLTEGVTAGVNRVPTVALVKDQVITATQNDATEIESCRPEVGPLVGGGANPRIRISLNFRQCTDCVGPIGADGGTTNRTLKFLGATNVYNSAWGLAPLGGKVFEPSSCWQTVSFLRGGDPFDPVDPSFCWANSDGTNALLGNYGILEAIAFAVDDLSNSGPFRIYIDNLANGSTVIQDFEAASPGTQNVQFHPPLTAGSTTPFLLSAPNISEVSAENADGSANSSLISFQVKQPSPQSWVRLLTTGTGTPNPQVDLRLPISFRLLLLPVGRTNAGGFFTIEGPTNCTVAAGSDLTLTTVATPTNDLTYLWRKDGIELTGENGASLTVPGITFEMGGLYAVEVTGWCGSATNFAMITVVPAPSFSSCVFDTTNNTFTVSFATAAGLIYIIEYKDNLSDPTWTVLETIGGDGNPANVIDPLTTHPPTRFYRVRIP